MTSHGMLRTSLDEALKASRRGLLEQAALMDGLSAAVANARLQGITGAAIAEATHTTRMFDLLGVRSVTAEFQRQRSMLGSLFEESRRQRLALSDSVIETARRDVERFSELHGRYVDPMAAFRRAASPLTEVYGRDHYQRTQALLRARESFGALDDIARWKRRIDATSTDTYLRLAREAAVSSLAEQYRALTTGTAYQRTSVAVLAEQLTRAGLSASLLQQAVEASALVASRSDTLETLRQQSLLVDAIASFEAETADKADDQKLDWLPELLGRFVARAVDGFSGTTTWMGQRSFSDIVTLLAFLTSVYACHIAIQADRSSSEEAEKTRAVISTQSRETLEKLDAIRDAINEGFDKIAEAIAKQPKPEDDGIHYVIIRQVPLTAEQRFTSTPMAILHPNQIVQLVHADGKWIAVTYFDHVLGKPVSGWILKKYAKRIEHQTR